MNSILPEKHFTEAPPRYTEASLIKFLEERGIGRPSTYTPIITTIIARNYVRREGKVFVPTQLGTLTTKIMEENFNDIVDYKFTANMETDLDKIEDGSLDYLDVLSDFWKDFEVDLKKAEEKIGSEDIKIPVEETDIICDKCGAKMVVRTSKFGKFAACPNFPKCRNTKPLNSTDEEKVKEEKVEQKKEEIAPFKCEKCGSDMVLRSSRYGTFYACSKYPECKFIKTKTKELDVPCPTCGGKVITKYGKRKTVFYSCENYPKCDFSSWDMPTSENCPDCGKILFRKKGKNILYCAESGCGFKKEAPIVEEQE
jgi:DNA topoisomerase-1